MLQSRYPNRVAIRHSRLLRNFAGESGKANLKRAVRALAPALFALTLSSAAHAQGTMDFSGAQTLMGTFKYNAIDQIHESTTNPRQTFGPCKLEELAESIRQHGLIQPITVRPNSEVFEIVAGARRFRAAQLAELFSLPTRIVELTDAAAMEWQLVEDSQREDVHPYEEAQGFQRFLDLPGYDVTALVAKSGKSAAHIYARLSLLQLIPAIAEAFVQERITASNANLIARLPQEHQAAAFENCWRKDWQTRSRTCCQPSTFRHGYRRTST